MLAAFTIALVLVAVAELGDKTQMLTLVLAARHGHRPVLAGVAVAIFALQLLAVAAGGLVGALIPDWVLAWGTGAAFIGFGVWTLLSRDDSDDTAQAAEKRRHGPFLTAFLTFFIAEVGDKTQVMTMAIAADPAAAGRLLGSLGEGLGRTSGTGAFGALVAVWLGSSAGMLLVNGLAAVAGTALGTRLSPTFVRRASGGLFIGFGLLAIAALFWAG
jgi:Ca2+/H+ antiporter, TMEM165/GDT1 family